MGARLKRAAYGLNDAPRLWWNRLDTKLRSYGLVPTRADRCCYVLYSTDSSTRKPTTNEYSKRAQCKAICTTPTGAYYVCGEQCAYEQNHSEEHWCSVCEDESAGFYIDSSHDPAIWEATLATGRAATGTSTRSATGTSTRSQDQLNLEGALELLLDPITGSNAKGKRVDGVITIYVDDAFFTGNDRFHKTVISNLRKDFQVGHEDLNDVMFVGQRVRWVDKDNPSKAHIKVDQTKKIEELSEIAFDKSLKDNIVCSKDLHTQFRSALGQINWLQARTQFQSCYQFSRCASAAAAPTIGDVRAINKLVRKIRSQDVVLRFWPLKGDNLRIIGYPDAAFRNNADHSSQRGQVIFLTEGRKSGTVDTRGSLIDYESQKIRRSTLSTTVAELYSFMKCFGTCQFLRGLWMDIFGHPASLNMRTDANNLVTTAKTTHLPEQKETIY